MMSQRMRDVGAVLAAALWLSAAALAQDYEIRLERPWKVGDKYHVSATGRQSEKMTVTVGGKVVQSKGREFSVEFESDVTIQAVDQKGRATKESHAIAKCIGASGGTREALLAAGTVVVASVKGDDEVYEVDGRPVGGMAKKALDLLISLEKGGPDDDEMFGTRERKRVGQSWGINAKLAAQDLGQSKLQVKPEDITGTVTVVKALSVGGVDCIQLRADLAIKGLRLPMPPGFTITRGAVKAQLVGTLPVDVSLPGLGGTKTMAVQFVAKGQPDPNGPEAVIEGAQERSVTEKRTYSR